MAVAGKVGVAPLPPLAWGLRIPARTWERWSQLGWREGQAGQADGPIRVPSCSSTVPRKGEN